MAYCDPNIWYMKGDRGPAGPRGPQGESYEIRESKSSVFDFRSDTILRKITPINVTQVQDWVDISSEDIIFKEEGFYNINIVFDYSRVPDIIGQDVIIFSAEIYEIDSNKTIGGVQHIVGTSRQSNPFNINSMFLGKEGEKYSIRCLTDSDFLFIKCSISIFKYNVIKRDCQPYYIF